MKSLTKIHELYNFTPHELQFNHLYLHIHTYIHKILQILIDIVISNMLHFRRHRSNFKN